MMNDLLQAITEVPLILWPILLPLAVGVLMLIIPRKVKFVHSLLALLVIAVTLVLSVQLFRGGDVSLTRLQYPNGVVFDLRAYHFSSFITLFMVLFGLLTVLYSLFFMAGSEYQNRYYGYVLITVGASCGAALSNNLILFLIFWEIVTVMMFLLVTLGEKSVSPKAAGKSFVILGLSDCAMLFGIILLWTLSGTFAMDKIRVATATPLSYIAFIMLLVGAITKAGAMPFHSWIPLAAEGAPTPVMAFLPAALDKLLGIYLMGRLVLDIFILDGSMKMVVMVVGALTIILAVMMALVQHDLKRLLSFHAISQVGYMLLGIGTGVPIGIAGGLFHMLNHAIYKCCLFLCGGSVEFRAKTTELDKLGGLAAAMPVTFITCLIAAFSISGIPPLNGFVSKWMVYQGVVEVGRPIFLVIAMFGSALTLASFIKVLHALFWGRKPRALEGVREVNICMMLPMLILAALCVLFGVVPQLPLTRFIGPILGMSFDAAPQPLVSSSAFWSPTLATVLLLAGIVLGGIVYILGRVMSVSYKESKMFIGGEELPASESSVPGTAFYETIRSFPLIKQIYGDAEAGAFDIYQLGKKYGSAFVEVLRSAHDGVLSTYLSWCIAGLGILVFVLMHAGGL